MKVAREKNGRSAKKNDVSTRSMQQQERSPRSQTEQRGSSRNERRQSRTPQGKKYNLDFPDGHDDHYMNYLPQDIQNNPKFSGREQEYMHNHQPEAEVQDELVRAQQRKAPTSLQQKLKGGNFINRIYQEQQVPENFPSPFHNEEPELGFGNQPAYRKNDYTSMFNRQYQNGFMDGFRQAMMFNRGGGSHQYAADDVLKPVTTSGMDEEYSDMRRALSSQNEYSRSKKNRMEKDDSQSSKKNKDKPREKIEAAAHPRIHTEEHFTGRYHAEGIGGGPSNSLNRGDQAENSSGKKLKEKHKKDKKKKKR